MQGLVVSRGAAASSLNLVLDTRARAVGLITTIRNNGLIRAIGHRATNIKVIVHLIERTIAAPNIDILTMALLERSLNRRTRISLRARRRNPSGLEPLVCSQLLEEADDSLEENHGFVALLVVAEARRVERVDAGTVGAPFVLPELLVRVVVVLPVRVHVVEGRGLAGGGEEP